MKVVNKQTMITLTGILTIGLLVSFAFTGQKDKKQDKKAEPMLCVGNYWTEAEGKAFLETMRSTYTTSEA